MIIEGPASLRCHLVKRISFNTVLSNWVLDKYESKFTWNVVLRCPHVFILWLTIPLTSKSNDQTKEAIWKQILLSTGFSIWRLVETKTGIENTKCIWVRRGDKHVDLSFSGDKFWILLRGANPNYRPWPKILFLLTFHALMQFFPVSPDWKITEEKNWVSKWQDIDFHPPIVWWPYPGCHGRPRIK